MDNLNRSALGWTIVWVILDLLLVGQLALMSIPDEDMLLIGFDAAAIVYVSIRLRRSVADLKGSDEPPKSED